MTYDPSETQEGELTPDEQNSLAIGEALQEEQDQLLAGKFRDPEALEKGYLELQQKLGQSPEEGGEEEQSSEENEDEDLERTADIDTEFLNTLWEESQDEYSPETLNKLADMDPGDMAQMYLKYRYETEQNSESAGPEELTENDVSTLKGVAGGDESYNNMMSWANDTLDPEEIQMYDTVMEQGNPLACFFAVKALSYRYDQAGGTEGTMLTGTAPSNTTENFRRQAEVVRAMSDPRYENDPAYRQDVYDKLERSPNLNF